MFHACTIWMFNRARKGRCIVRVMSTPHEQADINRQLLEEVADLRTDMTRQIESVRQEMASRFEGTQAEMNRRFDTTQAEMNRRFEAARLEMKEHFDATHREMQRQFELNQASFAALQASIAGLQVRVTTLEVDVATIKRKQDELPAEFMRLERMIHQSEQRQVRWQLGTFMTAFLLLAGMLYNTHRSFEHALNLHVSAHHIQAAGRQP
jgi:chromosome segregation ATPase